VGPDGCSGTQVCADDGSDFGDCSCGSAPAAGEADDGCGCAVPGAARSGKVALWVGSLILLLGAARRRR
jgi:MYXO-CTERM domain-containing protein